MKLFTKCLIGLLSATLLLTSCTNNDQSGDEAQTTTAASTNEGANNPSSNNDDRSLEKIYNDFIKNVSAELPSLVQMPVEDDRFSYYFGINKPDDTEEAFVSEPMIGAMPFAITLLKVEDDANPAALAKEIKEKVDPRRWVCVTASYVETAVKGNVILLVLDGDNTRGQEIIDAFVNS